MRISPPHLQTGTSAYFSRRDAIIYALGIGCSNLKYLYENQSDFTSFPTIALALTLKGGSVDVQPFPPEFYPVPSVQANGPVLDGERALTLFRPLRGSEKLKMASEETAVSQAASGAIVQTSTILSELESGKPVARIVSNTFYVGVKDAATQGKIQPLIRSLPQSVPMWSIDVPTHPNQTAIYRLSGDYNPLHIDPEIAQVFGYDMPIMHGLCTLGIATHALVQTCLGGDESRVAQVGCRFSKPFFPGRTLTVEIWKDPSNLSFPFRVKDKSSNTVVIDKAYVDCTVTGSRM
jgi:acyl dehydratase